MPRLYVKEVGNPVNEDVEITVPRLYARKQLSHLLHLVIKFPTLFTYKEKSKRLLFQ